MPNLPNVLFLDDQLSLDADLRKAFCSSRLLREAGEGAQPSNMIARAYFEAGMAAGKPDIELMKLKILERWSGAVNGGESWALVCIDMSWGADYSEFGAEVYLALRADPRLAGLPIAMLSDRPAPDTERVVRSAIVEVGKGRDWSPPTCLMKQDTDAEKPFLKRLCLDGLIQDDALFVLPSADKKPVASGTAGASHALLCSLREMRRALADRKEGGLIIVRGEKAGAAEDLVSYARAVWDRTFELNASTAQQAIRSANIRTLKSKLNKRTASARAASSNEISATTDDELGLLYTFDRLNEYNDDRWEYFSANLDRQIRARACVVVSISTEESKGLLRYNELAARYQMAPIAWPRIRDRGGDALHVFRRCHPSEADVGISDEAQGYIDETDWSSLAALKNAAVRAFNEIGRRNRNSLDLPDVREAISRVEITQARTVNFEELLEIIRNFRFRQGRGDVGWEELSDAWPKFKEAAADLVDSMYATASEHPRARGPKNKINARKHGEILDHDAGDTGEVYRQAKRVRDFLGTKSKLINDWADKAR